MSTILHTGIVIVIISLYYSVTEITFLH